MPTALSLTHWSDPMCIWAYVTESRLDRLIADLGPTLDVTYRLCPVFGSIPWRLREGPWAEGGVQGRVESTRAVALEHGHPEVSGQVWTKGPTSSTPACAVVKAAQALEATGEAPPGAGAALLVGLRRAFFVDDIDISSRGAIFEVAKHLDLPMPALAANLDSGAAWAALAEDQQERDTLKLRGSPTYAFDGGRVSFFGNFPEEAMRATVSAIVAGLRGGGSDC